MYCSLLYCKFFDAFLNTCSLFFSKSLMEGEKGTIISPPSSSPDYTEICEGKAKLVVPKENSVFYNPVQVFNRDLRYETVIRNE